MFSFLLNLFTQIISAGGYLGVGFLMTLESMVAPVPSEAVLPFAGFMWFAGKMSFWPILLSATLGSIIGSVISYCLGLWGGRPLIARYGKYLLLNEHHLVQTEKFFNRFGPKAIFISRFIPVIRHLISLPAGFSQMNFTKFVIYTILGAGLWNAFLIYLGYYLGNQWAMLRKYSEILDVLIVIIIFIAIIWFIRKQKVDKK